MASIGTAYVEVKGDYSGVTKGAKKGVAPAVKIAGAAITAGIAVALKGAITEGREAIKVGKQTNAVIKSTGGAARVSAKEVSRLAEQLSVKAGVDDELIQSGENLLLTFTKVRNEAGKGNDIFNQGTKIALDMSVALGQDMKSSVIQVGKALNDPIKGVTALQRVGVSFTKDQKEQIKTLVETGDTLGAQKLILRELNTEFKGSAAAQADPFDKFNVAVKNLQENIGVTLLPVLGSAADALSGFIDDMQTGEGIGGGLVAGVKSAFDEIKGIIGAGIGGFEGENGVFPTSMFDGRDIGQKISDGISAGLNEALRNLDVNQAADALLQVLLKAVNLAMDPAFWKEHWQELAMIIPLGKIFKIPGIKQFADLLIKWFGRALSFAGKAAGRFAKGIGSGIIDGVIAGAARLPGRVQDFLLKAVSKITGLVGRFRGGGGKIGEAVLNGFEAAGNRLVTSALSLGKRVVQAIKKGIGGTIKIPLKLLGKINPFAAGGPITKRTTPVQLVGEKGPELVSLPAGSYVHTADKTKALLADGRIVQALAGGGRVGKMLGRAVGISNKRQAYDYGGGHGSFIDPGGYDCSGYVSTILAAGGFLGSPTDTVGLRGKMRRGAGKNVIVGVRGGAGKNGHTMIAIRDFIHNKGWRYFEAGGKKPTGERSGWNGSFDLYHPAGEEILSKGMKGKGKGDKGDQKQHPVIRQGFGSELGSQGFKPGSLGGAMGGSAGGAMSGLAGWQASQDGGEAAEGESGPSLADAIADLAEERRLTRLFAEQMHTAISSVTEASMQGAASKSLGGYLSQMMLTLSPRMAP